MCRAGARGCPRSRDTSRRRPRRVFRAARHREAGAPGFRALLGADGSARRSAQRRRSVRDRVPGEGHVRAGPTRSTWVFTFEGGSPGRRALPLHAVARGAHARRCRARRAARVRVLDRRPRRAREARRGRALIDEDQRFALKLDAPATRESVETHAVDARRGTSRSDRPARRRRRRTRRDPREPRLGSPTIRACWCWKRASASHRARS